ncbi:fibrillin-1 isoform X1 [Drosophila nasuta]|uniref:fibrillin-1 isoform X1 n=1 Tax=Drosophila nasuta TaxID=42062 RepID=UPI00295EB7DD|nr:fibrillin-1 isoform X1 [Drosophila nasuta]
MSPAHLILCVLSSIAFSGVANAVYEDCQTPPPVDHAQAELFVSESNHVNTAIYSCASGYVLKGPKELLCNVDTEEWQGEPPICLKAKGTHSERKQKLLAIVEDFNVPAKLVPQLDLSCIQAKVEAPQISHGIVARYERKRRGEKVFLVAYYACNENYEFENTQNYALYCGAKQWVGDLPACYPRVEYTDDNEENDDDGDNANDDDYNYNDYEAVEEETETPKPVYDTLEGVKPPPPPPPVEAEAVEVEDEEEQPQGQPEAVPAVPTTVEPKIDTVAEPKTEVQTAVETEAQTAIENEVHTAVEPQVKQDEGTAAHPEVELKPENESDFVVPVDEPKAEPELVPSADATNQTETQIVTESVTDINIVVPPTSDPYSPRLLDENCGEDRGGCAQKCERVLFPGENEPRLKCSCYKGFTLDPQDYSSCHDIDECQESNGGCSQICNNLPGGYECGCEKGYEIDAATRNTCVDIDECAQPEVIAECANGCENTPGSYRCVIALNAKEEAEEEEKEEDEEAVKQTNEEEHDNEIEVGPEEPVKGVETEPQPELKVEPEDEPEAVPVTPKPTCNPGFGLSPDGSICVDINECDIVVEDDSNIEHVPHRVCQQLCENTLGSFRCSCRDGFHLLEDQVNCAPDNCEALDNPQLNRTRCAHECENLESGGYVCVCPEGYRLGEDAHSCEVLESVCSREQGHERCRPGSCLVSEDNSTFSCLCPPGYASEVFSCQDIDECAQGTHKCSHDCFNTAGGYQCLCPRGMSLQEPEGHACVAPDPCAVNNNGCEQLCRSAENGICACSKGYVLSEDGKSCNDVDECKVNNGGCQQLCHNVPGAYECHCSTGYEMLQLPGLSSDYCFDIDECAQNTHSCEPPLQCENLNGSYTCLCEPGYAWGYDNRIHESFVTSTSSAASSPSACLDIDECSLANANCSHFCINLPGSFQCACPLGFTLNPDDRSCSDHDECLQQNGNCAQLCLNQPGGFACACNSGFELAPDGFGCLDIDECSLDFGNCSGICINLIGSHECACDRGYELAADGTCQDVDECAGLLSGGCTHECINKPGSFECGCPLGYLLQEDERSCRPALVGCPPGTEKSEQGCSPIECGEGMLIGVDGSCVDIDECHVNNGGCSHLCENAQGSFKCACPAGYKLAENAQDCVDIDECAVNNGGCEETCLNEAGSFKCSCGAGKKLSFDERSCYKTFEVLKPSLPPAQIPLSEPRPMPLTPLGEDLLPQPAPSPVPLPAPRPIPTFPPFTSNQLPKQRPIPLPAPRPISNSDLPTPIAPQLPSDRCVRFEAPANGRAHCNRYRHKRKLHYNTRCKVRCNAGYVLLGSEIRNCGITGNWEGEENKCVPAHHSRGVWLTDTTPQLTAPAGVCPPLPAPSNGVIVPANCTRVASTFGTICNLQCNMGFVPVAGMLTTCFNGWSLGSVLECKPFGSNLFDSRMSTRIVAPWQAQQTFRQHSRPQQSVRLPQPRVKLFITCPENVVIMLGPQQTKAHVILQRPATNADYRYVAASPTWARQLQGHLPEGVHKVIFRATDPTTQQSVGCQTLITIRRSPATLNSNPFASLQTFRSFSLPPRQPARLPDFNFNQKFAKLTDATLPRPAESLVKETPSTHHAESNRIDLGSSTSSYCPPSFEVHLKEHQNLRSVLWEEPRFEGKLLKIFKSSFPGALFGAGDHTVKYEATTTDGRTLQCTFIIHVKPASASSTTSHARLSYPGEQETHSSLFAGHESYVICPDKEPVRVTSQQSVNLPVGCSLKNVRPKSSALTKPKRGLLTSLWRQYGSY